MESMDMDMDMDMATVMVKREINTWGLLQIVG